MLNVFEYPFVGIGIAFLSMIALWLYRALRPDKKRKWHFAVPFIIIALAFGLCFLVQTDKEKILAAFNTGIKSFQQRNIEPIREIIADDYSDAAHGSKALIVAYCQAMFEVAPVEKVTTFSRQIEIEQTTATFTMESMVKFTEESEIAKMGKAFLIIKARLHFKKTPEKKWLIVSSEILELDRKPVNWNQLNAH
ncbi:MAG: hypothetical protein WC770_05580 [Phycisphaerae bacterium]|jgi:hypothetical protein